MGRFQLVVISAVVLLAGCHNPLPGRPPVTNSVSAETGSGQFVVTDSFPHDSSSYTEGLLCHDGKLFESTGHTENYPQTHSLFGTVDRKTGRIDVKARLDDRKYFGEGIVFLKGKVFQLTDTTQVGFIYDERHFRNSGQFVYKGEGWGLTTNGAQIIMSNGSSQLTYRDPADLRIVKTLSVTDNNGPVNNLNELELVGGFLYANKWLTDYILSIDTLNGEGHKRFDISGLHHRASAAYAGSAEANGIAWDSVSKQLFVTGKLWPKGYVLRIDP